MEDEEEMGGAGCGMVGISPDVAFSGPALPPEVGFGTPHEDSSITEAGIGTTGGGSSDVADAAGAGAEAEAEGMGTLRTSLSAMAATEVSPIDSVHTTPAG